MDITPCTIEQSVSSYGNRYTKEVVTEIVVETRDDSVRLPAASTASFEHEYGFLLDIDVQGLYRDETIRVEISSESYDEFGYNQWTFESVAALENWLQQKANLITE